MGFLLRIIIGMSLAFASPIIFASDTSMQELDAQIKGKEVELNAKLLELNQNREAIQKAILNFKQQEKNITAMKQELDALKQQFTTAKKAAQPQSAKATKSKLGKMSDDVPCTCVFNTNREWNPEKIIWKDKFWECANYKDDGTCSKVQVVEGAVVE